MMLDQDGFLMNNQDTHFITRFSICNFFFTAFIYSLKIATLLPFIFIQLSSMDKQQKT
jgi:hypothetical protein